MFIFLQDIADFALASFEEYFLRGILGWLQLNWFAQSRRRHAWILPGEIGHNLFKLRKIGVGRNGSLLSFELLIEKDILSKFANSTLRQRPVEDFDVIYAVLNGSHAEMVCDC